MSFKTVLEKTLPTVDCTVLSWCPTMDLLVVSVNAIILWVYRLNGQRVYAINAQSRVTGLAWQRGGKAFALSTADGNCRLYDSNTGKLVAVVHRANTQKFTFARWSAGAVPPTNPFAAMFAMDCTKSFPKLMPDPSADTDILFVGLSHTLDATLYGLFTVPGVAAVDASTQITDLVSPKSHFLFSHTESNLEVRELDMSFLTRFESLPEITLTSARILAALAFLGDSARGAVAETRALADSQRHNLEALEGLIARDHSAVIFCDTTSAGEAATACLYDMLLTGMMSPGLRTWLDELGDRGIKKQARTANSGYDSLRRSSFNHLIPALELLVALLSRLHGYAQWEDRSDFFGIRPADVKKCINTSGVLLQRVHAFVWGLNEEQRLFNVFSEWLACVASELGDETRGFTGKTSDVSRYIRYHVSPKSDFSESFEAEVLVLEGSCSVIFDSIKTAIKAQIRLHEPVVLTQWNEQKVKIVVNGSWVYVAVYENTKLAIFRFESLTEISRSAVRFDNLLAWEFAGVTEAVVLAEEGTRMISAIDYTALAYTLSTPDSDTQDIDFTSVPRLRQRIFGDGFQPKFLAVNGAEGRRIGCVVSEERQKIIIFDLDDEDADDGGEDVTAD